MKPYLIAPALLYESKIMSGNCSFFFDNYKYFLCQFIFCFLLAYLVLGFVTGSEFVLLGIRIKFCNWGRRWGRDRG